jgi:hypothetical protein
MTVLLFLNKVTLPVIKIQIAKENTKTVPVLREEK